MIPIPPNPLLGIALHAVGALSSSACYTPQKQVKRWSWQTYWLTQAAFCWFLLGMAYGVGGTAFGVSIRYSGFSLTYAIAVGLSSVLGTPIPPLVKGTLAGILPKTGADWVMAGVLSAVYGFALEAGEPIADVARTWWFKADDLSSQYQRLVSQQSGLNYGEIILRTNGNHLYAETSIGNGPRLGALGRRTLSPDTWYQVVYVRNGSSVSIYLNGALDGSVNGIGAGDMVTDTSLKIGSMGNDTEAFHGVIDELLIFSPALTQDDVTALYNGGAGVHGTSGIGGLIAGCHFDEGQGTTAADFSGHEVTGTLHSSVKWAPGRVLPTGAVQSNGISGEGPKYSRLLCSFRVDADRQNFGEFYDWCYWSGSEWAGYRDLPPGYWVYVAPNWYIFAVPQAG